MSVSAKAHYKNYHGFLFTSMSAHGISDRMRSLCPEGYAMKTAQFVRSEQMKRRSNSDDGKQDNGNAPDAWDDYTIALVTPPENLGGERTTLIFCQLPTDWIWTVF